MDVTNILLNGWSANPQIGILNSSSRPASKTAISVPWIQLNIIITY